MNLNYAVVLDRNPRPGGFYSNDYFPKGCEDRGQADFLVRDVARHGGRAHVVPHSQMGAELFRLLRRK